MIRIQFYAPPCGKLHIKPTHLHMNLATRYSDQQLEGYFRRQGWPQKESSLVPYPTLMNGTVFVFNPLGYSWQTTALNGVHAKVLAKSNFPLSQGKIFLRRDPGLAPFPSSL